MADEKTRADAIRDYFTGASALDASQLARIETLTGDWLPDGSEA